MPTASASTRFTECLRSAVLTTVHAVAHDTVSVQQFRLHESNPAALGVIVALTSRGDYLTQRGTGCLHRRDGDLTQRGARMFTPQRRGPDAEGGPDAYTAETRT